MKICEYSINNFLLKQTTKVIANRAFLLSLAKRWRKFEKSRWFQTNYYTAFAGAFNNRSTVFPMFVILGVALINPCIINGAWRFQRSHKILLIIHPSIFFPKTNRGNYDKWSTRLRFWNRKIARQSEKFRNGTIFHSIELVFTLFRIMRAVYDYPEFNVLWMAFEIHV